MGHARLEKKGQNPPNIGYRTNVKDTVTWDATVEKAGTFGVALSIGCANSKRGDDRDRVREGQDDRSAAGGGEGFSGF